MFLFMNRSASGQATGQPRGEAEPDLPRDRHMDPYAPLTLVVALQQIEDLRNVLRKQRDHLQELSQAIEQARLALHQSNKEHEVRRPAFALRERRLTRCIDLRQRVDGRVSQKSGEKREQHQARVKLVRDRIVSALKEQDAANPDRAARFLIDQYVRHPYKGAVADGCWNLKVA